MRILTEVSSSMSDGTIDIGSSGTQEQITVYTDETLTNTVLASMDTLRQAGQLCDCVLRVCQRIYVVTLSTSRNNNNDNN